jgi:hypothetical protein
MANILVSAANVGMVGSVGGLTEEAAQGVVDGVAAVMSQSLVRAADSRDEAILLSSTLETAARTIGSSMSSLAQNGELVEVSSTRADGSGMTLGVIQDTTIAAEAGIKLSDDLILTAGGVFAALDSVDRRLTSACAAVTVQRTELLLSNIFYWASSPWEVPPKPNATLKSVDLKLCGVPLASAPSPLAISFRVARPPDLSMEPVCLRWNYSSEAWSDAELVVGDPPAGLHGDAPAIGVVTCLSSYGTGTYTIAFQAAGAWPTAKYQGVTTTADITSLVVGVGVLIGCCFASSACAAAAYWTRRRSLAKMHTSDLVSSCSGLGEGVRTLEGKEFDFFGNVSDVALDLQADSADGAQDQEPNMLTDCPDCEADRSFNADRECLQEEDDEDGEDEEVCSGYPVSERTFLYEHTDPDVNQPCTSTLAHVADPEQPEHMDLDRNPPFTSTMAHVADPEQPEPVFAEPQERHRCRNGHALKTFEIPNDSFVFVCDLCGSDLAKGSTSYTCWVCNYDVCLNCFNKDEAVTLKLVAGPEVEMGDLYFTPRAVVPPIVIEGTWPAAQNEAGFTIAMQHRPLTVTKESICAWHSVAI